MSEIYWKKAGTKNLRSAMLIFFACTLIIRLVFTLLFAFLPGLQSGVGISPRAVSAIFTWPSGLIPAVALCICYWRTAKKQQMDFYHKPGVAPVLWVLPISVSFIFSALLWLIFSECLWIWVLNPYSTAHWRLWWISLCVCVVADHVIAAVLANILPPDKIAKNRK